MREELDFKSLRFFSALYRLGNVSQRLTRSISASPPAAFC